MIFSFFSFAKKFDFQSWILLFPKKTQKYATTKHFWMSCYEIFAPFKSQFFGFHTLQQSSSQANINLPLQDTPFFE